MADAPRQRVRALVLSGVFPGLGQFYNRQPVKGAVGLAAGIVFSWLAGRATPSDPLALDQAGFALFGPLCGLLVVWLWSIIDAWRAAGR